MLAGLKVENWHPNGRVLMKGRDNRCGNREKEGMLAKRRRGIPLILMNIGDTGPNIEPCYCCAGCLAKYC